MTPEETKILMDMAGQVSRTEQAVKDLKKELLDNGQPGFITQTKNRLVALERNDLRRTWIERIITAAIATVVSLAIAMHDHIWK